MRWTIACIVSLFISVLFSPQAAGKAGAHARPELLQWEQADKVLPKYSVFKVRDLETGLEFAVQRRAGSRHADVQPLSSEDTAIMKKIYNGKWSWRRRAIIVISDGRQIAASMHGMPHGAGALKNNFPGHFCIHFYGSTTHRRDYVDLSHQLMVLKSAGKLAEYMQSSGPYEVVSAYITGFKEQDEKIVKLASLQNLNWKGILPDVDNAAIMAMPMLPEEDIMFELILTIPVEIEWYIKNKGRRCFNGDIRLVRFSPAGPWKVDSVKFLQENDFLKKSAG